jgi:hypothetical protein
MIVFRFRQVLLYYEIIYFQNLLLSVSDQFMSLRTAAHLTAGKRAHVPSCNHQKEGNQNGRHPGGKCNVQTKAHLLPFAVRIFMWL